MKKVSDIEALALIHAALSHVAPDHLPEHALQLSDSVGELGLDSVTTLEMLGYLEERLGILFLDEDIARVRTMQHLVHLLQGKAVDGVFAEGRLRDAMTDHHAKHVTRSGKSNALDAFLRWPQVRELEDRLAQLQGLQINNPYFSMHERVATDTCMMGGRELLNFSSYNYLGLSGDPRVVGAVQRVVARYGTSVSASRIASGERPFHRQLEQQLAACQGVDDAVVLTAGHATNVTTIGHLFGPRDLILYDAFAHNSILEGIRLSGATRRGFRHDDPQHLRDQLSRLRSRYDKLLIVVEGVYSMDGDICNLPAYIALKDEYNGWLMVDEAHSFGVLGVTGKGIGEHYGVDGRNVELWMGTLSKSLASCGGWIAGNAHVIKYLRYTSPGFVYSAGMTPANTQAALSALQWMLAEPERVHALQRNGQTFYKALNERGFDTGTARGETSVVPIITGSSLLALRMSQRLIEHGINVQPIVYPAVRDKSARLRFFLSSMHSTKQLLWAADKIEETWQSVVHDTSIHAAVAPRKSDSGHAAVAHGFV